MRNRETLGKGLNLHALLTPISFLLFIPRGKIESQADSSIQSVAPPPPKNAKIFERKQYQISYTRAQSY